MDTGLFNSRGTRSLREPIVKPESIDSSKYLAAIYITCRPAVRTVQHTVLRLPESTLAEDLALE